MQNELNRELNSLWASLQADFAQPDFVWQVVVLLACLGAAKLVERFVAGQTGAAAGGRAWQLGQGGLRRIAFPLVAAALVLAARAMLRPLLHVELLSVALPLLFSLAGIRMVFYVLRHSFSQSAWLRNFERSFSFVVWGLVAMHILGILPDVIGVLESVGFTVGKQKLTLWTLIQGVAAVAATLLGALWAAGLIEARLTAAEGLDL